MLCVGNAIPHIKYDKNRLSESVNVQWYHRHNHCSSWIDKALKLVSTHIVDALGRYKSELRHRWGISLHLRICHGSVWALSRTCHGSAGISRQLHLYVLLGNSPVPVQLRNYLYWRSQTND